MRSTMKVLRNSASTMAIAVPLALLASAARANPAGGTVTSGSASIANSSSGKTNVHQTSEGVVIDWSSFDIAKGQTTQFEQPNAQAIAVNRIGSANASQILGTLDANGRIVLINGNGILFGKGAQVSVGSLVATSTDGPDSDVLSGKFTKAGSQNAAIVNQGRITAREGGVVALVASNVSNAGTVNAKLGTVALGAANKFTVDFAGDGLVSFAAQGDVNGRAEAVNTGRLSGANVSMTARAAEGLATGVVNAGGAITAQSAHQVGGMIVLDAGDGGSIAVSHAKLNASGASGGGTIQVGGWNQNSVTIDKASILNVSATEAGNGGSVHVQSRNNTGFDGLISANGAGAAGAGGNVEVSSKGILGFRGFADLSAASGRAGSLLLDPTDLFITSDGSSPEAGASAISVATLESELSSGNVTLTNESSGTQKGDITVAANFTWSSVYSLTLDANRNIYFDSGANVATLGGGSFVLHADEPGAASGTVVFKPGSSITDNGSSVSIFYNPTSYASPTNYAGNVALSGGATLTAYMLVNSLAELNKIGQNATTLSGDYALGRNINASASATENSGAGFAPIGSAASPFEGIFDGLGFSISGLTINSDTSDRGMFGDIGGGAFVHSFALTNVKIAGGADTGGLAGVNEGLVDGVSVSGTVSGFSDSNVLGGLVGNNSGTIAGSSVTAKVSGAQDVGGIAGSNIGTVQSSSTSGTVSGAGVVGGLVGLNSNTVETSNAKGAISSFGSTVGGLVGENDGGTIDSSSATGAVSGNSTIGGLVGQVDAGSTIDLSFATGAVTGSGSQIGGLAGLSTSSLIESSYAKGKVDSPGANDVGGLIGQSFGDDIESSYAMGVVTGDEAVGGLVGDDETNGATKAIINLSYAKGAVTASADDAGGLVGSANGTGTKGSVIEASYATGKVSAGDSGGGLVGFAEGESITQSYATGAVSGGTDLGGLVGQDNDGTTITGSHAAGMVTGTEFIGGLVGNDQDSSIGTSYATGNVAASSTSDDYAGGLVGQYVLINATSGAITSSYAKGSVTASGYYDGGLVGYNQANITSSYATGNVTASGGSTPYDVGGLAGYNDATITSSHASGIVSGENAVGGLVGDNAFDQTAALPGLVGVITNSYATGEVESPLAANSSVLGGLVGYNGTATQILNSHATGHVLLNVGLEGYVGGLAGYNQGTIKGSYASGPVTAPSGSSLIGGLVGQNEGGIIDLSYATGDVTGGTLYVGGLVGQNYFAVGEIENSYATGKVTASLSTVSGGESSDVGGLVGDNYGSILNSYATGSATGNDEVGGLVGVNESGALIQKAYANGAALAKPDPADSGDGVDVGGLVGDASGTISYVYATGNANGYDNVGGLIGTTASGLALKQAYSTGTASSSTPGLLTIGGSIGANNGGTFTDVYWDSTNNPGLSGTGCCSDPTTALTTAQLMSGLPAGFSASVWGSNPAINNGLPYLLALPPN